MSPRRALRFLVGQAAFAAGVVALAAGPWLARDATTLASCLIGGIICFAIADLILPFPERGDPKRW
jgi:hypothetical protein